MTAKHLSLALATAVCLSNLSYADLIIENVGGTFNQGSVFKGQSFTMPAGATYRDITFSFVDNNGNDFTSNNVSIFSGTYNGTPSGGASNDPDFIATAVGTGPSGSGQQYLFDSSVELLGGTKYWIYETSSSSRTSVWRSTTDVYAGGELYMTGGQFGSYSTFAGFDANFRVGATAVPEPTSFAMLGLVGCGLAFRRRRRKPLR